MLTVTGGAQVAKINLTGDYLTSTFTLSSDGHGGTVVTDPPPQLLGRRSPPCPLITAIAGFGGAGGASHALVTDTGQMTPIALGGLGAAHPAEITVGHLALIATSRA